MPLENGKPNRPKTVYVRAHRRRKPEKTGGLNPTVFKAIVEHDMRRMPSELCR